jgi:D-alanyl-lipoteichoic acid acyltransferase DltB (MBOAT superfamily)
MLFNTFEFLLFYIVVLLAFFGLPQKARWLMLLVASCVFYMAFIPAYIVILGFTIVVDYFAGMLIEDATRGRRKLYLLMSLVANIGTLAVFKYYGFLNANWATITGLTGLDLTLPALNIILPIGLSFHTFQAMSYTIEVYRGNTKAERHFGIYALYVMFFPQLVAGPIERPQNMLHQFRRPHRFVFSNVATGLRWMLWGLFKKAVIADQISRVVNEIYGTPQRYTGPYLILATVFFAIQIYCDFSGYSDIAIGCAKIMGYDLMVNFKQPYFAKTISEFWSRWHISLSTWFRDYLYIPLGGNRVNKARLCLNLMVVFLVSGLWHGAAWTFVIWGGIHGLYLIFGMLTKPYREKAADTLGYGRWPGMSLLRSLVVFLLVLVAWVFFRARTTHDALYVVSHMLSWHGTRSETLWSLGLPRFEMLMVLLNAALLFGVDYLLVAKPNIVQVWWQRRPFRWFVYVSAVYWIVFFGLFGRVDFIYFQF